MKFVSVDNARKPKVSNQQIRVFIRRAEQEIFGLRNKKKAEILA
jgi:hypothetical protein